MLTHAGKAYLAHVKRILEHVDTAKHEAAGVALGRTGHLRIGHGTHLPDGFIPRVLARFQADAPHVAIDLMEAPTPRVLQALQAKSVEVGFLITPADSTGLIVKPLLREALVIAVPEDHALATAPLDDLRQLKDENFVLCRRYEDPGYREIVEGICQPAGFTPRVLQAVEHKQTVLDLVAEGLGISFVQWSTAASRSSGIRYRQFPKVIPYVDSAIAWREDAQLETIARLVEVAEREAALLDEDAVMPMLHDAVRVKAV